MSQVFQIVLVRHGEPDFAWPDTCTGAQFMEFCAAYSQASLAACSRPPKRLRSMLGKLPAPRFLSSDLPRAVQSGTQFVNEAALQINGLFAEFEFPEPAEPEMTRTPREWIDCLVEQYNRRLVALDDRTTGFEKRLENAAAYLLRLSLAGCTPVLFGHGVFNSALSGVLQRVDWRQVAEGGGDGYWSWRKLAFFPPGAEVIGI